MTNVGQTNPQGQGGDQNIMALLQLLTQLMKKQGQGGSPIKSPPMQMMPPPGLAFGNMSPALLQTGNLLSQNGQQGLGTGIDALGILSSLF